MAASTRTQPCSRTDAQARLRSAHAFLLAAQLLVDDDTDPSNATVAASLCVLAGIAASDAACCARLGRRPRGKDHYEAVGILKTVEPHGAAMAKDLARLLDRKDDAHYGISFVGQADAAKMATWTERLLANASAAVAA